MENHRRSEAIGATGSGPARRLRSTTALAGAAGMAVLAAAFSPSVALANPAGGTVVAGQAAIVPGGPGQLDIVQTTSKAIIDWQRFGVGETEHTRFQQPDVNAIALNRVVGTERSDILGRLSANGQVWLVNPNGIVFGPNAKVDVGGLIATTHNIRNEDFLAGNHVFEGAAGSTATVENAGAITVAQAGLAAFVAPGVINRGTIEARLGEVTLASGRRFVVDLFGDQKINIAMDAKTDARPVASNGRPVDALVKNEGKIFADGGRVRMTATAAKGLVDRVVNMTGTVQARTVEQKDGEIILLGDGGDVEVAGALDASGSGAGQKGGTVVASGDRTALTATARVNVSGHAGGGEALIGGDVQGGRATAATLAGYNIRPARKPVPPSAVTVVEAGAVIAADATVAGQGGKVVVWAEDRARFDGAVSAKGGAAGGDGGFVETSGKLTLQVGGRVDAGSAGSAGGGKAGSWLLDPTDITIVASGGLTTLPATNPYEPTGDATIQASAITSALAGTDVTIQTGSVGGGYGDITVSAPIAYNEFRAASLTLKAHRNIIVNAGITAGNAPLNLTLNADSANTSATSPTSSGGAVLVNVGGGSTLSILTNGGNLLIGGGTDPTTIPARGPAGGVNKSGVEFQSVNVDTGGGDIRIRGKGGTSSSAGHKGVLLTDSHLQAGGGLISLTGIGGSNDSVGGGQNFGVELSGSQLDTIGVIEVTGTGGRGPGGQNHGVAFFDSTVTGEGGALAITGTGGNGLEDRSSGGENLGVSLSGGLVKSTGGGAIQIHGQGGEGYGGFNHGVKLSNVAGVESNLGALTVTGIGGSGRDDGDNVGFLLGNGSSLKSLGSTITVTGDGGSGETSIGNDAMQIGGTINGHGTVTLTAQDNDLLLTEGIVRSTNGSVLVDGNGSVRLDGGGNPDKGRITAGQMVEITAQEALELTASAGISAGQSVVAEARDGVTMDNATVSGSQGVILRSDGDVWLSASAVSTNGGAAVLNANRSLPGGLIKLDAASSITTSGGAITLGGGTDPTTGAAKGWSDNYPNGVTIADGSQLSSGGGAITITGENGEDVIRGYGVVITGSGTGIDSGTGTVTIRGTATSTATHANCTGACWSTGVLLDGSSGPVTIHSTSSASNAILIDGNASGATTAKAQGMVARGQVAITTETGGIVLKGQGGQSASYDTVGGLELDASSASELAVHSTSGSISLEGTTGNGSRSTGIRLVNNVRIGSTASTSSASAITLTADTMELGDNGSPTIDGSGPLVVQPRTASTSIGLAGGSGTLDLSDDELATFGLNLASLTIGRANGSGLITVGGPWWLTTNLTLRTPNANGQNVGIALQGSLTALSTGVTLNSGGMVTQYAPISAARLELLGTGSHNLSDSSNSVQVLAGDTGSVTLNNLGELEIGTAGASAGLRVGGGTLSLSTTGRILQTAALGNVGLLSLSAGGDIELDRSGVDNTIASLGHIRRGGSLNLSNSGNGLTLTQAIDADPGNVTIRTAGNLTLNSGASVAAGGSGSIVLAANGRFINNAGASALTVDAGRWLVYAADAGTLVAGGLTGDTVYGRSYASYGPSAVTESGNLFIVAAAQTVPTSPPVTPVSPPVSPPVTPPVTPPVSPPVSPPVTTDPETGTPTTPVTPVKPTIPETTDPETGTPTTPTTPETTGPGSGTPTAPTTPAAPATPSTTTTAADPRVANTLQTVATIANAPVTTPPPPPTVPSGNATTGSSPATFLSDLQQGTPDQSAPNGSGSPASPPAAPVTVTLASGRTMTFSPAATAAYSAGATLTQPSPQVFAAPQVQAAAAILVQGASGDGMAQAVAVVAGSGLTPIEQRAVLQSVPVATLIGGLTQSPDPVAAGVGAILQNNLASGTPNSYAEVRTLVSQANVPPAMAMAYLAMAQRVQREQRTQTLGGALRQLVADPSMSDMFSRPLSLTAPTLRQAGGRRTRGGTMTLRGIVADSANVAEARVNGRWVFIDEQGQFRTSIPVEPGRTEATLTMTDEKGDTTEQVIQLDSTATAAPDPAAGQGGKKIALMIAVDSYRNNAIPTLATPAADIALVGQTLNERLGYETRVLRNPTKAQIGDALRKLGREVGEQDQVMVYYAGHGYELSETGAGYWLPADADTDSAKNWVSNNDIGRFLSRMPAKHVMVVSDSCYSGAFTKEQKIDAAALGNGEELRQRRSVMALSSGGDEPVADGDVNSPFAAALVKRVRALPKDSGGFGLYQQVREDVSREAPQTPQYGVIKAAGYDEGGDFLLGVQKAPLVN
ncbi:filamentous hemagglutinin N-terminal domain-containing protein [Azospirillum doebereinerae]|uniref:two-partner secretion domain-containing protein n=1 Tax=Azospirillum doebereinerae TaxID=92933 RepID=UPI00385000CA